MKHGRVLMMIASFGAWGILACARVPPDWRDAARIETFKQSACAGDVAELTQRGGERMKVIAEDGRLRIDYFNAQFRCDQRAAAYARVRDGTVDILVQPADMHPLSVAKCDCLYDIHLEVPGLAAGTYDVTLQRRWDDRQSPNEPLRVGTERVSVR